MKMKKLTPLLMLVLFLSACATKKVFMAPNNNFRQYQNAYVEFLPVDEFNLGPVIVAELSSLGLNVYGKPLPAESSALDLQVKYTYTASWNMVKFLKSAHIIFSDAQTGVVLSTLSYNTPGAFTDGFSKYNSEARIHDVFEEFRNQLK